jgi:hypothetical protein
MYLDWLEGEQAGKQFNMRVLVFDVSGILRAILFAITFKIVDVLGVVNCCILYQFF